MRTSLKKLISSGLALCLSTSAGVAEQGASLCGNTDNVMLLQLLSGQWQGDLTASVESETISVTQVATQGVSHLAMNGAFTLDFIETLVGDGEAVQLHLGETVYDVDAVDDLLETTETAWMADELSDTRCGPADLPQFSGTVNYAPDLTGKVTLIGYFSDRILMLSQLETRGDYGIAYVTSAALLTPRAD